MLIETLRKEADSDLEKLSAIWKLTEKMKMTTWTVRNLTSIKNGYHQETSQGLKNLRQLFQS